MAESTDSETKLLSSVENSRLRTSLTTIREAMEDIWAPDAPRKLADLMIAAPYVRVNLEGDSCSV